MNAGIVLAWQIAAREAIDKKQMEIEPIHFLWGIILVIRFENKIHEIITNSTVADQTKSEIQECKKYLSDNGYLIDEMQNNLSMNMPVGNTVKYENGLLHRSSKLKDLFQEIEKHNTPISLINLLREILENKAVKEIHREKTVVRVQKETEKTHSKEHFLDQFAKDITLQAKNKELNEVYGRSDEIKKLGRVLLQKNKKNAILVGEAGVGKTAIVEGLAIAITNGNVPTLLKNKKIYELSITSLVSGTKFRGEFEERMERIIEEASNQNVILFIDEIHNMIGAGQPEGSGDASNILKPALGRGKISVIGATTVKEYRKYIEKDSAFERRFQKIYVSEPGIEDTIFILKSLRAKFEDHYNLKITDNAIINAVSLAERYLTDLRFPDKAIDLIDTSCSQKIFSSTVFSGGEIDQSESLPIVNENDVYKVVSNKVNIPISEITNNDFDELAELEDYLNEKIIGQENAIKEVTNAIKISKAGFKEANKPISVLLLYGPTGVGKTQLAKEISNFLFKSDKKLIRFDMSEYMEKHEVSKLIGAPPGYIGSEEEGILISKVRSNPYSVILFDEIEKAHKDINNIFLQIFEEGELTSSQNKKVSFSNTIIILTTNLGSKNVSTKSIPGVGFKATKPEAKKEDNTLNLGEIKKHFSSELLNRISRIVAFNYLDIQSIQTIFEQHINNFSGLMKSKNYDFTISEEVKKLILENAYSREYGVRHMKRVIEDMLFTPLANFILQQNNKDIKINVTLNEAGKVCIHTKG